MNEDSKTDETQTQTEETNNGNEQTVTMPQSKFDEKWNQSFGKGANKANADLLQSLGVESIDEAKSIIKAKSDADEAAKSEHEKALEVIETFKAEKEKLQSDFTKLQEQNNINALAAKHGVTEVEYFQLEYNTQKGKEGFNVDTFMAGIKESKPMLFGSGVKPPGSDRSPNIPSDPNSVNKKLKDMTLNELKQYQNSL